MEQDIIYYIVMIACVAAVYILCIVSLVKLVFAREARQVKTVLLDVGLFAVVIVGCLFLSDMTGPRAAMIFALTAGIFCFALHILLSKKWARDVVRQQSMMDELHQQIEGLQKERLAVSPESLCAQAAREFGLTRREEEMLLMLSKGESYSEIAQSLYLSQNTVKSHIRSLYKKMGSDERASFKEVITKE